MLQLAAFESAREPPPAEIDAAAVEQARAMGAQQLQMLTALAEVGLELAAETARRVKAEPMGADAGAANYGLAYARIARAVRMTIALQSKVMADLLALEQTDANARRTAAEAVAEAEAGRATARRDRVGHIVTRLIEAEHGDDETVERLAGDAWERLSDSDAYGDLGERPIGEIVVEICRDLGLSPDWTRLAREAWAMDEAFSPPRPQGNAEIAAIYNPQPFVSASSALPRDLSG